MCLCVELQSTEPNGGLGGPTCKKESTHRWEELCCSPPDAANGAKPSCAAVMKQVLTASWFIRSEFISRKRCAAPLSLSIKWKARLVFLKPGKGNKNAKNNPVGSISKTKLLQIDTDSVCKSLLICMGVLQLNFLFVPEILITAKSRCLKTALSSFQGWKSASGNFPNHFTSQHKWGLIAVSASGSWLTKQHPSPRLCSSSEQLLCSWHLFFGALELTLSVCPAENWTHSFGSAPHLQIQAEPHWILPTLLTHTPRKTKTGN